MIYISKMVNLDDLPLKNRDFKMIYLLKMVIFHTFFACLPEGTQFLLNSSCVQAMEWRQYQPLSECLRSFVAGHLGFKGTNVLHVCEYLWIDAYYIYIMPWLLVCMCFKIVHAITYIYIYIYIYLYMYIYIYYMFIDM